MAAICARQMVAAAVLGMAFWCTGPAQASFHLWRIDEIFSDASGAVQFIELAVAQSGEQFVGGRGITATQGMASHTFTFPNNLPGDSANHHFLIGTQSFANLGVVSPDFIVPDGFLFLPSGSINYADVDMLTYPALPNDGVHSVDRMFNVMVASPTNFAGQTGMLSPPPAVTSLLENPQPGSFQSGIGLLSGWSCLGPSISVSVDGKAPLTVPYGSARADTAGVCGGNNINTGFGLLINFNTLGAGSHTAHLIVNGQAVGTETQFTVTVPNGEFITGVNKEVSVSDFPTPGKTTSLIWQQAQQNFAVKSVGP